MRSSLEPDQAIRSSQETTILSGLKRLHPYPVEATGGRVAMVLTVNGLQAESTTHRLTLCTVGTRGSGMMKSIMRGLLALLFSALMGLGVHLILKEQESVSALSEQTTATVVGKQVVKESNRTGGEIYIFYRPVLSYRYQVGERTYSGSRVFPEDFAVGGNLGHVFVRAPLEAFEVDQETKAYYNPDDPSQVCLIRRPAFWSYGIVLGATVALSIVLATFPAQDDNASRLKGQMITALWYVVGLATAVHYSRLAGAHCAGLASLVLGLYMVWGLFPVSAALGGAKSSALAGRLQSGALASVIGAFVGLWVGLALGYGAVALFHASATFGLRCMGYGIAVPAAACLLIGFLAKGYIAGGVKFSTAEPPQ